MLVDIKKIEIKQFRYRAHLNITFNIKYITLKKEICKKVIFSMSNYLIERNKNNLNTIENICTLIARARDLGNLDVFNKTCSDIEKKHISMFIINNIKIN